MVREPETQRIRSLTPLAAVLAQVDAVQPVAARDAAVPEALGAMLADDVIAAAPIPSAALALRDGWAVRSDATHDAGSYAPAPLSSAPRLDAGERLPAEADAVAPIDAVELRQGHAQALMPVAPGDGMLVIGGDVAAGQV